MKKNLTEMAFILDRSGSMSGLESDTIGGYNSMLKKQKKELGDAKITTVLFDDQYELLNDREDIKLVKMITKKEYYVRGCTALLDAIGKTIVNVSNQLANITEEEKPEKVIFIITTDGLENASREFSYSKIKEMIEHQKQKYGWEFIFLGANIDAVNEGAKIGITADRTANFHADTEGLELCFMTIDETVSNIRNNRSIHNWNRHIEKDYKKRK